MSTSEMYDIQVSVFVYILNIYMIHFYKAREFHTCRYMFSHMASPKKERQKKEKMMGLNVLIQCKPLLTYCNTVFERNFDRNF